MKQRAVEGVVNQPNYEKINFSEQLQAGWISFQGGVRRVSRTLDEGIQVPNLVVRTFQVVVTIFSMFPQIDIYLEIPKQLCKDAKNFTNILRGFKSVDGVVNFKLQFKAIILNISGLTMMVLSVISVIDRFHLLNVTVIKVTLTVIPIIGVLPFGGLLPLSIIGLVGTTLIMGLEKQWKMNETANLIRNDKLAYWSQLDLGKIQQKIEKYQYRVEHEQQNEYVGKLGQWRALARSWNHIRREDLEKFRWAKESKWQTKLNKLEQDKVSTWLSMITHITVVSRQIFLVGAVLSGFGLVAIPFYVNLGFDLTGMRCDLGNYFIKKSIRPIQVSSVSMAWLYD